jgi:F0F1-type ATP synthase epsilon subunit
VTNELTSYEFTVGKPGNYNVTTANGKLTMTKASKAITITAASQEWTYDGSAHSNPAVSVTSGSLLPGDALVANATGSVTNVSETAMGNNPIAAGYKVMHGDEDVTENYAITTKSGTLTINPAAVTVTAQNKEFTYTGEALSWPKYDVQGLVGNDSIKAVVTGIITFPSQSPVINTLTSYEFIVGDANNYNVTRANGSLTMTTATRAITITAASGEWTYDGSAHSANAVSVTIGSLLPGDELVATATGSVTDVADNATGNNPIATNYMIKHGTQDVTENYTITTQAGTLTINPKAVTVTAQDKEFVYTGEAHSWPEYDVDGLVGDDAISAVVTGSITFPSESPVTNELASYEFTTGTPGNYSVTTANGKLTMTKASVPITLTAASQEWTYDGAAHSNSAVTVTSGSLLSGDVLVAEATGSVTNVAQTATGNNPIASGYKVMHGTEDVTANYVFSTQAGKLTIKPKAVTVTANSDAFTYDGTAHSNNGYDVDGLVGTDAITATVEGNAHTNTVGMLAIKKVNDSLQDASKMPNPVPLFLELWYQGEVSCLFSDSNLGKSLYAVQFAEIIAKNHSILYLDCELSEKQFQLRYTD